MILSVIIAALPARVITPALLLLMTAMRVTMMGGASDASEEDESIDKETMSNIEMPLTVSIETPRPTVAGRYGQQLLTVPLRELLDHPTAKQSHQEAIGYAIKDISDRLHDALLDYDHDYNPEYLKSTDLKKMKCLYNLLGDLNHCQVTDTNLRVCGDQDGKLCPNCGIHTPVMDDMNLHNG
eukprot:scaffold16581_cov63-Attheya_sp.AAC.2